MQIVERETEFHITIPFNHFVKQNTARVKALRSRWWDPVKKVWKVPASCRSEVMDLAHRCHAEVVLMRQVLPERVGEIPPMQELRAELPLRAELRPYQRSGIAQAMHLKRCIIGDEQGLGKTLQSIGALIGAEIAGNTIFPCLVIAPSTTKINWQREWEKFSDKKALILNDVSRDNWQNFYLMGLSDVFIVNYESLKKFFVRQMPPKKQLKNSMQIQMDERISLFKSVIVDESHRCKDPGTQQSKLTLRICQGKEYVFLLTGTPIVNKPIDLFPQLAILNQLAPFGGRKEYLLRYCDGGNGASNLRELNYKLNLHCYFRREKKDVARDLPEKQRQTIVCDITTREEYDRAQHKFEEYLRETGCTAKEIARKMRGEIMVKMGELKRISALGKLPAVCEFIQEVIEGGEKLIVFCVLHTIVDAISEAFPGAVTLTGRDSIQEKQQAIDAFQTNPDIKLIICNIKAAGVGINLTASSRVAFVEYPWTYADCVQCEDRAHRIGQENHVMCSYFLGKDTIDEHLYQMIQEKRHIANTITGATDTMEMDFVDNILNLFNSQKTV